jgi:hypothetical protein
METLNISKVFYIREDYTLEELKKSYIEIIEKLYISDRTQIEKNLLTNQYKQFYKEGKQKYLDRTSMNIYEDIPNYPYHSNYSTYSGELEKLEKLEKIQENLF